MGVCWPVRLRRRRCWHVACKSDEVGVGWICLHGVCKWPLKIRKANIVIVSCRCQCCQSCICLASATAVPCGPCGSCWGWRCVLGCFARGVEGFGFGALGVEPGVGFEALPRFWSLRACGWALLWFPLPPGCWASARCWSESHEDVVHPTLGPCCPIRRM